MPEVETLRRQVDERMAGRRIIDVVAVDHRRFADAALAAGSTVETVARRGKFLLFRFADGPLVDAEMVVHLGMTGRLSWKDRPAAHVHAGWVVADATLWLADPRRFGRVVVVAKGDYATLPTLSRLGGEVDDPNFNAAAAAAALTGPGTTVKGRLLDQRAVAGVGNYVADEALWRAGVAPQRRDVDAAAAARIVDAVRAVTAESLAAGGVSERDFRHLDGSSGRFADQLAVHGRAARPCRRCTTTLASATVAGRSTVWCPTCQPD